MSKRGLHLDDTAAILRGSRYFTFGASVENRACLALAVTSVLECGLRGSPTALPASTLGEVISL
jgi:hypothetical protein